jgi:hypothetical protein
MPSEDLKIISSQIPFAMIARLDRLRRRLSAANPEMAAIGTKLCERNTKVA